MDNRISQGSSGEIIEIVTDDFEKFEKDMQHDEAVMHGHRRRFMDTEAILREKGELLKHHENKVVQLKKEYEKKLAALNEREKKLAEKGKELKSLGKRNITLFRTKRLLEKSCRRLAHEEAFLKDYIARARKDVGLIHHEEAKRRADVVELQRKISSLKGEFDRAYQDAGRVTTFLKTREAELKRVTNELSEATRRHSGIIAQITCHSLSEIKVSIKRAEDDIKAGNFSKARQEYEQIRKFYSCLPRDDKRKAYSAIEGIKAGLLLHEHSRLA